MVWSDDESSWSTSRPAWSSIPGPATAPGPWSRGCWPGFPDLAALADGAGGTGERDRPGIVHRLDKGTSGLLMVARTPAARAGLTAQLAARRSAAST